MVKDYKYRIADQLKKLYRVSTIFSPIFFDKDILVLTNFSPEEPLIAPVIASAALYWTDSIFLENDALEGWS